jgi:hypothetical protein
MKLSIRSIGEGVMDAKDVRKLLASKATVPLWPEAGTALGLTRGQTYKCSRPGGDIEVLRFGKRKFVASEWLRHKLGINDAA